MVSDVEGSLLMSMDSSKLSESSSIRDMVMIQHVEIDQALSEH